MKKNNVHHPLFHSTLSDPFFIKFPDAALGPAEDPHCIGGDYSPRCLISAYLQGFFPWPHPAIFQIPWFSPAPRAVFDVEHFVPSKSQKKMLRQKENKFSIKLIRDTKEMEKLISACGQRGQLSQEECEEEQENEHQEEDQQEADFFESTWLTESLKAGYLELFKLGLVYGIGAYGKIDDTNHLSEPLLGGFFGVCLGDSFISAESMFYHAPNASKVALVSFLLRLQQHKNLHHLKYIDIQVLNPFTQQMQGQNIDRDLFLSTLASLHTEAELSSLKLLLQSSNLLAKDQPPKDQKINRNFLHNLFD